jgi:hypothetical protein
MVVDEDGPVDERTLVGKVLRLVQEHTGFALVMATRVLGDDWRVLATTSNPYAIEAGDTFRWSDSICSRMVGSDRPAPWSVPDVDADLAACVAPVRTLLPIASYLGAPLVASDGRVLGTLCAIDPKPVDRPVDGTLVSFAAEFVSWVFERSARAAATERAAERIRLSDAPGQAVVIDRRQWDHLLASEIARTQWSGESLTIALVRVAGRTGTRTEVRDLARRLAGALGGADAVAVLGSNRLGVAAIGGTSLHDTLHGVAARLRDDDVELRWVASSMTGRESAPEIERELEVQLVGAGPATARAASALLTYSFCAACGRKGAYALRDGRVRCKYCQAVALVEPDMPGLEVPVSG